MVKGLAQDLLWADPETGAKGFQKNQIRGVSWVFGENAVHEKIKQLGIDMVIRAHQVICILIVRTFYFNNHINS